MPTSTIFTHALPSDFVKNKNASWHALEHEWRKPFLLTTDEFGAATNLWRLNQLTSASDNNQDSPRPILLKPPLPHNRYVARITAHLTSPNERFLAIAIYAYGSYPSTSWRVYDLSTGFLISESDSPETQSSDHRWRTSGEIAATLTAKGGREHVILQYRLTDKGNLEQVQCVIPALDDLSTIEHVVQDGSVFISTAVAKSRRPLAIVYYPPHSESTTIPQRLEIPFTTEGKDTILAENFVQVSERSLAFVVEENEWDVDFTEFTAVSTVCLVTYMAGATPGDKSGISLSWVARFDHKVHEIAYLPSLGTGTIIVRGKVPAPYAEDGSRDLDKHILAFLDASTGTLLKKTEQDSTKTGCFLGSNWVVYDWTVQTPWLYILSLARVMEIGLEGVENSEGRLDGQVRKLEIQSGPEPWNSKARKSAVQGRWRWVNGREILPDGKLVLFPERGLEFWLLDPTVASSV